MVLWRRWLRDTAGATMVEFSLVAGLLFFLLFAAVEGALLLMWWNQTEKAVQAASRLLVVSPPAVTGLPATRGKNPALDSTTIRFGAGCEAQPSPCAPVAVATCQLDLASGATTCGNAQAAQRVVARMRALSPLALREDGGGVVTFTYEDTGLGFVGGPYIPIVEVRVQGLRYRLIAMAGLSQLFGVTSGPEVAFPPIAATLIGEDLNHGAPG